MAARKQPAAADVAAEVVEQPEQPRERVFRLRDAATVDSEGTHRVCVGSNPRVSLGPGETFATRDPRVAFRLAQVPELEEVTA